MRLTQAERLLLVFTRTTFIHDESYRTRRRATATRDNSFLMALACRSVPSRKSLLSLTLSLTPLTNWKNMLRGLNSPLTPARLLCCSSKQHRKGQKKYLILLRYGDGSGAHSLSPIHAEIKSESKQISSARDFQCEMINSNRARDEWEMKINHVRFISSRAFRFCAGLRNFFFARTHLSRQFKAMSLFHPRSEEEITLDESRSHYSGLELRNDAV